MVSYLNGYYKFKVVTYDKDCGETHPYKNIKYESWNDTPYGEVFYYKKDHYRQVSLYKVLKSNPGKVIYVNSFFGSISIAVMLLRFFGLTGNKIIAAPRGEFCPDALNIKRFKKTLYLKLFKALGIHKKIFWHATSRNEYKDIINYWGNNAPVTYASNIPLLFLEKGHKLKLREKKVNKVRVVIFTRIHKTKNISQVFRYLKDNKVNGFLDIDVYGILESEEYYREFNELIRWLPSNIKVSWKGEIKPDQVLRILSNYHLYISLTLFESYGHTIIEALSAGCVTIISDKTPWKNLEEKKAGWNISSGDAVSFIKAINDIIGWDQVSFNEYSRAAFDYANKTLTDEKITENYQNLFG